MVALREGGLLGAGSGAASRSEARSNAGRGRREKVEGRWYELGKQGMEHLLGGGGK
jgi:hypothetical protein